MNRSDASGGLPECAGWARILSVFIVVLLSFTARPATATAQVTTLEPLADITTGELIGRLRKAGHNIVEGTPTVWRDSAETATLRLRALADRLEGRLSTDAAVPLSTLSEDLEDEIHQGLVALILAEDLADAIRTHPHEDVRFLLTAFSHNFRDVVGSPGSWSRGRARVMRLADRTGEAPHVAMTGAGRPVVLRGIHLRSDDCGSPSAVFTSADGDRLEVEASSSNDGAVAFEAPPLRSPGVYDVEVRVRRKKLIFFCGSTKATISVGVLPASSLRIRYTVSTTQAVRQEIAWNAGELKMTNDACNDTTASGLFRLPEGWSYASHEWTVYLAEGAVKTKEEVQGDGVYVEYRVAGRKGPFCTGDPGLVHGRMEIHGTRDNLDPGPEAESTYPRRLAFGERVVVPVEISPPDGAFIARWSIAVRVIFPDGSVQELPVVDGSGALQEEGPCGAGFSWDPEARQLELVAPAASCARTSR